MELLNIILDPYKLKSTCFLCFKQCENMSSLLQKFAVFIEYKTFEMRLKDIFFYLFPAHDTISDQACSNCVDLLLQMFALLHRNLIKKTIFYEIVKKLSNEVNGVDSSVQSLHIKLRLPTYEDLRLQKDLTYYASKKFANDNEVGHQEIRSLLIDCKECNMSFPTHELVKKHKKVAHSNTHKAVICEYCGKNCKKHSTLKAHLNSHKNSTCPYCFKVLKSHSYFKLHVKCHETNTKVSKKRTKIYYHCDICPFKSLNSHSLQGHINKAHLQIRPFVCDICNKGFYRKSNLVQHISIHSKSSCMTCEHCGDKFLYKKTLLDHLRLHSGDKPFECEICKQHFVTSGRRTDHVKRKHMEKSIQCLLCDKKFSLNSELNTHVKKYHGASS